ncbi:MAG: dihydropteroate synthase [Prevotella sp.]|nr:dihydropteroate synthase [Prevotella sp.]
MHFPNYTLNINGRLIDLSKPKVMGFINVTPDSFYVESRKQTEKEILQRSDEIISEGGDIIDVGAFSTRPGATKVSFKEETLRLKMALEVIRKAHPNAMISVDTFRPEIALMAIKDYDVGIINDVSAGNPNGVFGYNETLGGTHEDIDNSLKCPEMFSVVAQTGVAYILMSNEPDILGMIKTFAKKVHQLRSLGAKDIILDPGFGFGKNLQQNYEVLSGLGKLRELELPILVGASRKSMIYNLLETSTDEALNGTTVVNTIAMLLSGASFLRVHDVKKCVEAVKIVTKTLEYV